MKRQTIIVRVLLAIVVLVALLVALGANGQWFGPSVRTRVNSAADDSTAQGNVASRCSRPGRQQREPAAPAGAPDEARDLPEAAVTNLKLAFVDTGGKPVPGVRYRYYVHRFASGRAEADSAGTGSITTPIPGLVVVEVCDFRQNSTPEGVARSERDFTYSWWSEQHEIAVKQNSPSATILVHRAVALRVDARYEDGSPWVGGASLAVGKTRRGVSFSEATPVTIHGVPADLNVQFLFPEIRMGFARFEALVESEAIQRGDVIQLQIPRSAVDTGGLAILCESLDTDRFLFRIRPREATFPMQYFDLGTFAGRGTFHSQPLPAGAYELVAHCFTSDAFGKPRIRSTATMVVTIAANQETEVVPLFQQSGAAELTVLDASNQPISGAVVQLDDGTCPTLFRPRSIEGFRAVTDSRGTARLAALAPGKTRLRIEAVGFEPSLCEVNISPDAVSDGGTVRLSAAEGMIVLTISGAQEGAAYVAFLGIADSSTALYIGGIPIQNGRAEIRGLPLGRVYCVVVGLASGGLMESQDALVGESSKLAVVDIPVGSLR